MDKEKARSMFDSAAMEYDSGKASQFAKQCYPYMLNTIMPIQFDTVLDVGCGTGSLLYEILDHKPQVKTTGLDISEEMLRVAKAKLPKRVELVRGDMEAIPIQNKSFDLVVATDILRYCSNPQLLAREMYRVLKVGGNIILSDFCVTGSLGVIKNIFNPSPGDASLGSSEKVKSLLMGVGFDFVNYTKVTNNCFVATGQKRNE